MSTEYFLRIGKNQFLCACAFFFFAYLHSLSLLASQTRLRRASAKRRGQNLGPILQNCHSSQWSKCDRIGSPKEQFVENDIFIFVSHRNKSNDF
jgi:hypothetical protein